ncbi:MAG: DUF2493 domain-containing protein [Sphingomonadaceae bacterium]
MKTDNPLPEYEPEHAESSTAYLLQEMALYGYRPYSDEPDDRPLPDARMAGGAIIDIFDAMVMTFIDTRLEPDLEDLLWNLTNVFHRAGERIERELDDNEVAQKRSQKEQDGSEVKSVELETHLREGTTMLERRDAMEFFRDGCADQFRIHIRKAWTPRSGSKVNRKALTSAVVSSRDFVNARQRAEKQVLIPAGTLIAFSSGPTFNDHRFIWDLLDRVHAKHTEMVLAHGATPTGGEKIAALWADQRKVPQIPFKPDWNRHKKAAPFKRNDAMLEALPAGVIILPGTGIQDNLHDKAKTMGIKRWDFRHLGGA